MPRYVIYSNDSIEAAVNVPSEDFLAPLPKGFFYALSTEPLENLYVSDGWLLVKRENPVYLEGMVLKNVPVNSIISINTVAYFNESNRQVELGFEHPGKYHVVVSSHGYFDKEFTIENPS